MACARLVRRVLATEPPVLVQSKLLDIQCHSKVLGFRGLKVASKLQEVVLTKDLDRVGKAGDIVKVAKGFARNKLIPEMLALPKLEKYVRLVKEQVEALRSTQPQLEEVEELQESKTEEQKLKEISAVLIRLDTQRVVLRRHIGEEGKLRQPVTKQDLVTAIRCQLKVQVQEVNLDMEADLLSLGEYEIPIRLPRNIELPGGKAKLLLKVRIRRK